MGIFTEQEALDYHSLGHPGKLETIPAKPCETQKHLSMAYSPGVADACMAIYHNPEDVYKYTGRGNLVAVVSNGTAVLGLGNIGPAAAKPVMEGKGVLFKIFADIDVYDINLDELNSDKLCAIVKAMEPTFGGINLEDIKAPECFYIENKLKNEMKIPVFHDDQHGTAIISAAGLLNALEINNKRIEKIRVVVSGAGASAISCAKLYINLGVLVENIAMFDSKGHINSDRADLSPEKKIFASNQKYDSITHAMQGADCFLGLSRAGLINEDMVRSMATKPIIFACANPDPEIDYDLAKSVRPDAIVGTGRSDFPNQINNVLCFPFIFRGALDVHASAITESMKIAATKALAKLAKQPVSKKLAKDYGVDTLEFGMNYIIPKPTDSRLIEYIAPAVAEAAMKDGVARKPILDLDNYKILLRQRMNASRKRINEFIKSYGLDF